MKSESREHEHVVDAVALAPPSAYAALRTLGGLAKSADAAPGQFAASGDREKTVVIWDTATGQTIKKLVRVRCSQSCSVTLTAPPARARWLDSRSRVVPKVRALARAAAEALC